jgi:hypothetical protein
VIDFSSSWPGLTRPSIFSKKSPAKQMDTRVKPAYDGADHAAPNSSANTKTSRVIDFLRHGRA